MTSAISSGWAARFMAVVAPSVSSSCRASGCVYAGYWHQAQMETITGRGTVVLIPPDAGKRKGARPGWDSGLYAFMRRVLASERGGELYAKRQGMIEPIFDTRSSTAAVIASNAAAEPPPDWSGD